MASANKWSSDKKLTVFLHLKELNKKNTSLRACCRDTILELKLDITEDGLRKKYSRYVRNEGKERGNMIFTIIEEQGIRGYIEAWCLLNRPLTRLMLLQHILTLRRVKKSWDPRGWFDKFMQRNKQFLSLRAVEQLSSDRVNAAIKHDVHAYVDYLDKWHLINKNITFLKVNCDETRLTLSEGKNGVKKLCSSSKSHPSNVVGKRSKCCTYVPFHSSDGLIVNFFVLPLDSKGTATIRVRKVNTSLRSSIPTYYIFSNSGWVNSEGFYQILRIFIEESKLRVMNKKITLYMDRLNIHMTNKAVTLCINANIEIVYLPKGTSHFLQPSDSDFFGLFKKLATKLLMTTAVTARGNRLEIGRQMLEAAESVIKTIPASTIKSSWKKTGLEPYNRDLILKLLNENFGDVVIEEENRITTTIKNMVKETLCESLDISYGMEACFQPPTETVFSGRELMLIREMKSKRSRSKESKQVLVEDDNVISHSTPDTDDDGDNNSNSINYKCCCEDHDASENENEEENTTCQWCHTFQYCSSCLGEYIEDFLCHEEDCDNKPFKKKRR